MVHLYHCVMFCPYTGVTFNMDTETLNQLTRALDKSMVRVLNQRLKELAEKANPTSVAIGLVGALEDLDGLRKGRVPNYGDKWLSLPYLSWYGPSHINMAYTLMTSEISRWDRSLHEGPFGAHHEDYACGVFAGQFAYVLAAANTISTFGTERKLSIFSDDISDPMWDMGLDLWKDFRREIGAVPENGTKYPDLDSIRTSARLLQTRQPKHLPATVWLTVFHAAYDGEYGDNLTDAINKLIAKKNPTIILLTAHKGSSSSIFTPPPELYIPVVERAVGGPMTLFGQFSLTTAWRQELFDQRIHPFINHVSEQDYRRALRLLKAHPTTWSPGNFSYVYSLYKRR